MKTEEQIKELAYKRYGTDPHIFGGQRNGFMEGYKMCQESLKDNWIKIESEEDLPNKEGSYWIYDGINVTTAFYDLSSKFQLVIGINCNATHYQPINKPNLPLT